MANIVGEVIGKSFVSSNEAPLDKRTLYQTVEEFLSAPENAYIEITNPITGTTEIRTTRFIGQKVIIQNPPEGDSPCEYWFKDGIADADLVSYSYEWENSIAAETNRATAAETNLQGQIDDVNAAIDTEVVTDVQVSATNTAVTQTVSYIELLSGQERSSVTDEPTASETSAGNMDSEMFIAFEQYGVDISEIKAMLAGLPRQVVAAGLGASPSQPQITAAFNGVFDVPAIPGDKVISLDDSDVWIMGNAGQWLIITSAEVELASAANPGLAKHSTQVGSIGYYVAGIGQVNGWDALNTAVTNAQAAISSLQTSVASKADNQQSLAATTNTDSTITTPAVPSNTLSQILQTIWNKINSFKNFFDRNWLLGTSNLNLADFNTLTIPGIFYVTSPAGGSANAPTTQTTFWQVVVFGTPSDTRVVMQIATYYNGGNIWMRTRGNGSWTSWIDLTGLRNFMTSGPYVRIEGDTMTGSLKMADGTSLKFGNNVMNPVGDDVSIGDQNVVGTLIVRGENGNGEILIRDPGQTSGGFNVRASINNKLNNPNGDPNQVMMGNGTLSASYVEFLSSLTGIYGSVTSLPSAHGYFVLLSPSKLYGLVMGGLECAGLYYCTIRRNSTSENFSIVKPWESPSSRIDSLKAELSNEIGILHNRISMVGERIGGVLNQAQVDSIDYFPEGVSVHQVSSMPVLGTITAYNSILITTRYGSGSNNGRQILFPLNVTQQGGAGPSNKIYSRAGAISSSLAWTAIV